MQKEYIWASILQFTYMYVVIDKNIKNSENDEILNFQNTELLKINFRLAKIL